MSKPAEPCLDGIPFPIVRLNRLVIVGSVLLAIVTNTPLITTALFVVILLATLFGRRLSLIYQIGSRVFAHQNLTAEKEDPRLMRFNNAIASVLLGLAQIAFLAGAHVLGFVFAGIVAVAATVALLGFCLGCFLYYQFNLNKRRLSASK